MTNTHNTTKEQEQAWQTDKLICLVKYILGLKLHARRRFLAKYAKGKSTEHVEKLKHDIKVEWNRRKYQQTT